MLNLTQEVTYDLDKPFNEQATQTVTYINDLMRRKMPDEVMQEQCSDTLQRPIRQIWQVGEAQVLRLTSYNHPPTHAACFATRNVTVMVRTKDLI